MDEAPTFGSTRPIIPAGTQLNGIYEIDEPIAAGGMGEIYKGHAIQTGDVVAIKLIRSDLAEANAAFGMFRKEAAALHDLYHEAIVRYYVFTTDPVLARPYLAMEYVDGESLSAILRGGPLAFEAVQRLIQRVAAGLQAAHEGGIVHRDVSPDNIIIPAGDMARAKIIDFGIARSTKLDDEGTVVGSGFAGKYNYVSPEQLGLFGAEVTPKSDIYSLGLVLAQSLRASPIDMGGNHVEVIEKRRVVPDISSIEPRLRPLIEWMLQPNPDDRPSSMAEVAAWRLDTIPARIREQPAAKPMMPQRPARLKLALARTPFMLAGVAALLLLGGAGGFYAAMHPAPTPSPPPAPSLTHDEGVPVKPGLAPMELAKLDLAPPQSAETPELAGTDEPGKRSRIDALTNFINRYALDDCVFIKPVSISEHSAAIEGFGTSAAPFRAFDETFRRDNGFEADIGVRDVTPEQCPAITFLSRLRDTPAAPLKLNVAASSLTAGQDLKGTVSGLEGREVNVLVVASDGAVHMVPVALSGSGGDSVSFSMRTGAELGNGKLQLVLAVASPQSLTNHRFGQPSGVDKVFAQMLAEAERSQESLAAAVRSFKVEK